MFLGPFDSRDANPGYDHGRLGLAVGMLQMEDLSEEELVIEGVDAAA